MISLLIFWVAAQEDQGIEYQYGFYMTVLGLLAVLWVACTVCLK
jgi:hypothetical protein